MSASILMNMLGSNSKHWIYVFSSILGNVLVWSKQKEKKKNTVVILTIKFDHNSISKIEVTFVSIYIF